MECYGGAGKPYLSVKDILDLDITLEEQGGGVIATVVHNLRMGGGLIFTRNKTFILLILIFNISNF